ncbi:3-phosphoshikimate 1-carboxyvinyltransferase [Neolewinella antarctica]|uniref:3-phosphoshikimate 1-carboxyvinyltransferase n=1 Tax=Neolewinella antarctica TaxID=442734 RepID=A0ABX0XDW5_9BACT|nr:3-phosphoshikimate 1-carboxyvinyltransferase [Neolewinella antarctica]NJC27397.1 3-phosphoshikimate 1-carboxyvinyltransferase [Neolewinella antarctica]
MYELNYPGGPLKGQIQLTGSKSIANRALIIRALCEQDFPIHRLAAADDTVRLENLLKSEEAVLDAGPAGTTFRFLTGYLSRRPGHQILTGSQRMKERPIGILVDALRTLGADIEYVETEGYPPLKIGFSELDKAAELTIAADTSSQYISSLLMLAPTLPNGLKLTLEGEIVSVPYIKMTLSLMRYFGVAHSWVGQTIEVEAQDYQAKEFTVEADWSAASYYYSLAALAPESADIQVDGLFTDSVQGDAVVAQLYERFGVKSEFNETGVRVIKSAGTAAPEFFEQNFVECPDIAQTLMATCAGLGTQGLFTGLQTLFIKETDRVGAMKTELGKLGVALYKIPAQMSGKSGLQYFGQDGKATFTDAPPTFATYHDHRMAMALAPLAVRSNVRIESPEVVGKSYPDFYRDLEKLGIEYRAIG